MSCAPNIRSLRFDKNIVSIERAIHVARLRKGCFQNGMLLFKDICLFNNYKYRLPLVMYANE